MKKLLIAVIGLVVLLVAAVVAGVAALNSEAFRAKVAAELSSALGQPVTIGGFSLSITPVPALSARDIKIGGAGADAAPGVALAGLRVVPDLASALPGSRLTINYVELDGLAVSVRRQADGKWLLPVAPVPAAGPSSGGSGTPAVDLHELRVIHGSIRVVDDSLDRAPGQPTITTIGNIGAKLSAVGGAISVPQFSGTVGSTTVDGSATLDDKGATLGLHWASLANGDLPAVFALAGMRPYPGLSIEGKAPFEMTVTMAPGFGSFAVTGKTSFATIHLGAMTLEDFVAPFTFRRGIFALEPLTFTSYKGAQKGSVVMNLNVKPASYHIKTTLTGLDVNAALSANTTLKDYMEGTGDLSLDVTASGANTAEIERSITGEVKFALAKGVVHDFPMIAALNEALGITGEGTSKALAFDKFSGSAQLGGAQARTSDLRLDAGPLVVTGGGTMGFDQTLDLKMIATYSAEKSAALAAKVPAIGRLRNAQGELAIPLTVTGTTTASKTRPDLGSMAKAQVQEVKDQAKQKATDLLQQGVGKGLQGLFGKKPQPQP